LNQLVVELLGVEPVDAGAAAGAAGVEELAAAPSVLAGVLVSDLVSDVDESDEDELLSPLLLGA
jgi:hypothetical protein